MGVKCAFVSLGCAKNRVDTETMMARLRAAGMDIVADEDMADVAIVNTCSFIGDAAQESCNTILDLARKKTGGSLKAVLVTGCLPQRYGQSLLDEMPEVDGVIGTGDYARCVEAVEQALSGLRPVYLGPPGYLAEAGADRIVSTPAHYAYVKIAEGCSNQCGYCLIPSIRGDYRSRPMEDILDEVRRLASNGAREIIVIAQDTTGYGRDLYGEPSLPELLERIASVEEIRWIRVMYTYPTLIDDRLISVLAREPKVLKYLDIPMQHGSDAVLARMNRRGSRSDLLDLVTRLRSGVPGIVIRSTFIVGYPGETEREFEELLDFIDQVRPERAGVFAYSREQGTPAASMKAQVPSRVKKARLDRAMKALAAISREYGQSRIGQRVEVVIDGPSEESGLVVEGRSYAEAPEVDGKIFIGDARLRPGSVVIAEISEAAEYDLSAEMVCIAKEARA